MRHFLLIILSTFLILSVSCSTKKEEVTLPQGVGLKFVHMDTTVNPADDFYTFANGGWMKTIQIPADQGRWGSFNELRESTLQSVLDVLKAATASEKYHENSDHRKAVHFFEVAMDSTLAEKVGVKPLQYFFDQIKSIQDKDGLQNYLALQQQHGGGAFFGIGVNTDLKKSDKMLLYILAGGVGLPERDYYTKTDEKSKEIRNAYVQHMATMLELSGVDNATTKANAVSVMDIETRLAHAMMTKEERRDPNKRYNKRSVEELTRIVPSINWSEYFSDIGVEKIDSVNINDITFLNEVERVLAKTSLENIKIYLRWHLLRSSAPFLNYQFVMEDFKFSTQYLRGIDQLRPRWKRVLDAENDILGEAIGQLYVEEKFPPEAKQKAQEMVENIKLAFAERIKKLDWMSDSTKNKALRKLSTFAVKIGYPDEWRDYAGLIVEKDPEKASFIQNVWHGNQFNFKRQIEKLGKPVNRKEWRMTPQTVNAYYNSSFNEIVFPAAILQPPFYDYKADDALNYGGIGAVIGHEISHGFDDQGSKFDANGNLANWWSPTDLEQFQQKAKALADQFSKYEPLPGVFVQGQFTLGENIGDLGGVAVAYDGLLRHLRENGRPGLIDGFTPEQRFFISWATIWRTKIKDESLRTQILTDPHSPGVYRAIGPLGNIPEFYAAFDIKEGDKMFRPQSERVKIW